MGWRILLPAFAPFDRLLPLRLPFNVPRNGDGASCRPLPASSERVALTEEKLVPLGRIYGLLMRWREGLGIL